MSLQQLVVKNASPVPFCYLPRPAQKALIQYLALESSGDWAEIIGYMDIETTAHWDEAIRKISKAITDRLFYYAEIDTKLVCECIMSMENDFLDEHGSFEAYHQWYASSETPKYPKEDRYPSLAWCDQEGILDGWHRFHSYVRSGHSTIPLVA